MDGRKKIYIDQLGDDPQVRHFVAEVPADWTDEDIERVSKRDFEDRFWMESVEWENTGDGVVARDEFKVVGVAPDDAQPDVILSGNPLALRRDPTPSNSNARDPGRTTQEQLNAAVLGYFPGAEEWDYGEATWEEVVKYHVDQMLIELLGVIELQDKELGDD